MIAAASFTNTPSTPEAMAVGEASHLFRSIANCAGDLLNNDVVEIKVALVDGPTAYADRYTGTFRRCGDLIEADLLITILFTHPCFNDC